MKNILIFGSFSIRDWKEFRQRQQVIVDFLLSDYRIFYVERISAKRIGFWKLCTACLKRAHIILSRHKESFLKKKNLHFIQLKFIPGEKYYLRVVNKILITYQIKKIMKKWNISCFECIIISHPARYVSDVFSKIPAKKRIYDCVQRFEFNEFYPKEVTLIEKDIAKKVDTIITDSITIFNEKKLLHKNVAQIPQGVDLSCYNKQRADMTEEPHDLKNIERKRVCYIGGFHQTFNYSLVKKITNEIPEANFVFIGHATGAVKQKLQNHNVSFLGWKSYEILPVYMNFMDVFILPYLLSEHGKGVFPTKLFEYLFFKRPVISTALPDIIDYGEYLYIAHTGEEFIRLLKNSLFGDKNKLTNISQKNFDNFLNKNSWESRYEDYKKHLMYDTTN